MTDQQKQNIFALIESGSEKNIEFAKQLAMGLGDAAFVQEVRERVAKVVFREQALKLTKAFQDLAAATNSSFAEVAKAFLGLKTGFKGNGDMTSRLTSGGISIGPSNPRKFYQYPSMGMFDESIEGQLEAIDKINRESLKITYRTEIKIEPPKDFPYGIL